MRKKVLIITETSDLIGVRIKNILQRDDFDIQLVKVNSLLKMIKVLVSKEKWDIIIAINSDKVFYSAICFLLKSAGEKIFFPYDISNFMHKTGFLNRIKHSVSKYLEKQMFLHADKIIHKGLKRELEWLPFYSKIKHKPNYLFREFLDKDKYKEIQKVKTYKEKLSKFDNEIHLVYVGGLFLKDMEHSESFWKFYKRITKQRIHLHIYSKLPQRIVARMREIEKSDPYFHYEGFREHDKLIMEIGKYDAGINLFGKIKFKKIPIILKVSFSNKIFDYLLSEIPIIINEEILAGSEFIKKYDLGIIIKYSKIKNLKNKLKNLKKIKISKEKVLKVGNEKSLLDFILK